MFGAVWAQAELRKSLGAAGARVIDREFSVPSVHQGALDEPGRLADPELRSELEEILGELVDAADQREPYAVAA